VGFLFGFLLFYSYICKSMKKKYKYRFKTRDELYKEFGYSWEEQCDMNDEGYMEYLLGTDVIIPRDNIDENGDIKRRFTVLNECPNYNEHRTWSITPKLIKKIDMSPDYKPKTFIRD
jgi:hypothetical protein